MSRGFSPAQRLLIFGATAWLASAIGPSAVLTAEPAVEADLLDLGAGAALVRFSSEYSTDWRAQWSALALLDGTTGLGWCSRKGAPFPHELVVELAARSRLDSLTLYNAGNQEASQPGISTREVEIYTSLTGPESDFELVARGEVERGGGTTFDLQPARAARWIRIVIRSNWGHPEYTELMELEATGSAISGSDPAAELSGVYEGLYGGRPLRTILARRGSDVTGCYSGSGEGRLSGHAATRSAELEWRQEHDGGAGLAGSLLLVVSDGGALSGLWYGRGSKADLVGRWTGQRVASPAAPQQGSATQQGPAMACPAEDLASTLDRAGRATLYGIRFASDSAQLAAAAEPTLRQILDLLAGDPELRLTIEGHTDSEASQSYNQDLSRRRAEAVRAWLVERQVAPDRLQAIGRGESQPVADNATSHGRRLNRRVEILRR
ncbi:MAG: OmpA family protein [Acidobacteriota bacterium]